MSNFFYPMGCSTPGLPVPHHLPEFAQVHVPCIGDAIQPYQPLTHSSPSALNLSQHQGLFQWVASDDQSTWASASASEKKAICPAANSPSPSFWDLVTVFCSLCPVFWDPWLLHAVVSVSPPPALSPPPQGPSRLWELSSTSTCVRFFCKEDGLFYLLYVFTDSHIHVSMDVVYFTLWVIILSLFICILPALGLHCSMRVFLLLLCMDLVAPWHVGS